MQRQDIAGFSRTRINHSQTGFILSSLFQFSGPVCLGLGIWFLLIIRQVEPSLDPAEFSTSSYLMIGAGGAIILYGVIGCLAIFNESRGLLGFVS